MKTLLITVVFALVAFIGYSNIVPASVSAEGVDPACDKSSAFLGLPTWYEYLDVGPKGDDPCAITGPVNPENGEFSFTLAIPRIVLAIVEILLRVAGMVAFVFIVYGGFRYITSQGEPEALKQAQGTIINAVIGMVIVVLAVTLVSFAGSILW